MVLRTFFGRQFDNVIKRTKYPSNFFPKIFIEVCLDQIIIKVCQIKIETTHRPSTHTQRVAFFINVSYVATLPIEKP